VANRNAVLISTRYDLLHNDAFAREQLRRLLEGEGNVSLTVADDYGTSALDDAGALVTYIAKTPPGEAEVATLRQFLERGGRWFALHTSNAVPPDCPLPRLLGSRFVTHPPYGPFRVDVTNTSDPLLAGVESFEVEDELYVCEQVDGLEVMLHARWGGEVRGVQVESADQPLMYRRRVGAGEVLYLALGHCNPAGVVVRDEVAAQRRGAWDSPVYRELVGRGVSWALENLPTV
jgi:type 1 glutamine amidotransferase